VRAIPSAISQRFIARILNAAFDVLANPDEPDIRKR
jgi:hypothetical protein